MTLLETENAELKNAANEAISLPVAVGDKCYWVVKQHPPYIQEAVVEEYKVFNRLNIYAMTSQGMVDIHYRPIYPTREEAEIKLNELRRKYT